MRRRILSLVMAFCMVLSLLPFTASAVETSQRGTCGSNLTWELFDNGLLTISGSGKMQFSGSAPWKAYASEIQTVYVKDGVQSIAANAFSACSALTSIYLPASLTEVGSSAVPDSTALQVVFFSGSWDQWEAVRIDSGNILRMGTVNTNIGFFQTNYQSGSSTYTSDGWFNLNVEVSGRDVSFDWQEYDADADEWISTDRCRNNSGSWVNNRGFNESALNSTVTTGTRFRCVMTDCFGSQLTSGVFTVTPMAEAAEDIALGEHPLRVGPQSDQSIYRFVPAEDGVYSVYSTDASYLRCEVYDAEGQNVYPDFTDQSDVASLFRFDFELRAGEAYILSLTYSGDSLSDSASFTLAPFQDLLMFSEPQDLTVAWNSYGWLSMGASARYARCYWSVQRPDGSWQESGGYSCASDFTFTQTSTPGDYPVRWEIRQADDVIASGEVTVTVVKPDPIPITEGTFVVPDQLITLYKFVPKEDGVYYFGSVEDKDGWRLGDWGVYDENWNRLAYMDFGSCVQHGLLAGRTYYLSAQYADGAACEIKRLPMPTLVEGEQQVSPPQLGEADGYFCFRPAQSGYYRLSIAPQHNRAGFSLYDGSFVWMGSCLSDSSEEPDFVTSYLRAGQNYYLKVDMGYDENYATVTIKRCDPSADFPTITAGDETASISADWNPVQYYNFVPEETGTYRFSAPDAPETIGWVFDSDWQEIASDDNSGLDNSFAVELKLQAGETYHFGVGYDSPRDGELSWSIELAAEPLSLVSQPMNCCSAVGDTASFDVSATGSNLSYQWQYKSPGSETWKNSGMTGAKTDTISVPVTEARNGQQYRCVVTDGSGETVTSEPATLIVLFQPAFTAQPKDVKADLGETAQFTVEATGGDLAYRWQYRTSASGEWKNSTTPGANTPTLSIKAESYRNGYQYRCLISNTLGSAASDPATLIIKPAFAITSHPQNAVAEGSGSAQFAVKATGDGLTYQWQYLTKGGTTWKNCSSATKGYNTATLTVVGISNDTNRNGYQYRCVVKDSAGKSLTSDPATLTVKLPAPTLTVTLNAKGQPHLTWTAVTGAAKYEVWRATSSGGTYSKLSTTTGQALTNSSAAAGTTYYYKVRAVASDGTAGVYSAVKSAKASLAAPTLTVTLNAKGQPYLTWTAVTGAAKYEVWRATSSGGTYTKLSTTTGKALTNSSAAAGSTYYYKVRALDANGAAGVYSAVKSAKASLPAPTLTVQLNAKGQPYLTWTAVTGAAKYEVWRSTSENGTYSKLSTTTGKSLTNSSATMGTTYYYKVRAVDANANAGAFSAVKSAKASLAAPTLTVQLNAKGQPYLTWTAVTGAAKYEIWRATSENGTYSKLSTTTGKSLTNSSATMGATYYYKVRAVDANGNAGAFSAVKFVKASLAAPTLTVTLNAKGQPYLTWTAVTGAAKYEIWRAASENGTYTKLSTTTGKSLTNSSAASGVTYYYKVRAVDANGNAGVFSTVKNATAK